jgi:hypothetical protein
MTTSDATKTAGVSLTRGWLQLLRYYLGNRWALLLLGALMLAIGMYLSWAWLVAAGVAPILLTLAPCAVMCAQGLCSMKMMGGPK